MTVGEALGAGRERLRSMGDSGRFDALRLLEDVLARDAAWIVAHRDEAVPADVDARYRAALERRARGEPVAYISGTVGFYGRTFFVNPDVLVPRPETEHIVSIALERLRECGPSAPRARVCDVGTGSGILAITLALEWESASVVAIDISSQALAVAARNARAHGVADRIHFVRGDTLRELDANDRFDCIVANLPYVKSGDLPQRPDPTAFEPVAALDGGPDGLDVYRRLLGPAAERLTEAGFALLEAGPDTAEALARLARTAFAGAAVTIQRDYSGRDRVVEVRRGTAVPSEKSNHP